MKKKLIFVLALAMTLSLASCATWRASQGSSTLHAMPWSQRSVQLSSVHNWNISGGISVTEQGKTQMGSFSWRQQAQRYTINVSGPLGFGSANIVGQPGRVVLRSGKNPVVAQSPERLMRQQLGWYIPISNAYYWVRGLPAPHHQVQIHFDHYKHIQSMIQQGWHIQYLSYRSYGPVDLPYQMLVWNKHLRLKLVISRWQFST